MIRAIISWNYGGFSAKPTRFFWKLSPDRWLRLCLKQRSLCASSSRLGLQVQIKSNGIFNLSRIYSTLNQTQSVLPPTILLNSAIYKCWLCSTAAPPPSLPSSVYCNIAHSFSLSNRPIGRNKNFRCFYWLFEELIKWLRAIRATRKTTCQMLFLQNGKCNTTKARRYTN